MPLLINLKQLKEEKVNELKNRIDKVKANRKPKLIIISASNDKASELYMNNKKKIGEEIGVEVEIIKLGKNTSQKDIEKIVDNSNKDNSIDGIIVQLPIYDHLDKNKILEKINSNKDADGFNYENLGKMFSGNHNDIIPCTSKSVYELLKHHKVELEGKRACLIGRGLHTNKTLASMLINDGATVTVCNSKTKNIENIIKDSDIVVSSVGKYELVKPQYMKEGSVLVGVGIDYIEGRQQTDYSIEKMLKYSKCSLVTDRVNSVGLGTVLFLMENVAKLYENSFNKGDANENN